MIENKVKTVFFWRFLGYIILVFKFQCPTYIFYSDFLTIFLLHLVICDTVPLIHILYFTDISMEQFTKYSIHNTYIIQRSQYINGIVY